LKNYNKILIFGGTGSLGTALVKRLLQESWCDKIWVFSRDEAKHHKLKLKFPQIRDGSDEVNCYLGDIRDYNAVEAAIRKINPTIIINAAALKQVPICEDYPFEAVQTNILGTQNLIKALASYDKHQIKVLSISTDKAAKPVNSYGMTKALQERIHLRAQDSSIHIYNAVRYGNVLESTGSVIPVFQEKIRKNENIFVTHPDMTRFLLSLDEAVDLIFTALKDESGGKIYIPKVKSAKIQDLADLMVDFAYDPSIGPEFRVKVLISKIRPGEKLHEILISEEETGRVQDLETKFVIHDIKTSAEFMWLKQEYSSNDKESLMNKEELLTFLETHGVIQCELE
jgi:FlaA1/EpsC-like NDP-sugar epimerase